MLQNATPLRKSAAWPPNISDQHVSCTAPATRNPSLQIFFKCPTPAIVFEKCHKTHTFCSFLARWRIPCACHTKRRFNVQKWREHVVLCAFIDFEMCFAPQRRALFGHLNFQKWSEPEVFCTFWLRHVLCATTATSKSGPNMRCFLHFDLKTCFAPQRRALFRHRNFQKWSDAGVFCAFWLRSVLRATTACTFSISQLAKVVPTWGVLYILTWKCASRHNGVQLFISHLARWLPSFSEPTFRPSGATNHWKNTALREFPTFSRTWISFLRRLSPFWSSFFFSSLLTLPISAFHLSTLSEVWLLNFLRWTKS